MTSWKLTENFAKLSNGYFSRRHTWFVYIQFLNTISSPWTPRSKEGYVEKWIMWHPDRWWKNGEDFVLHCTFWGLMVMLQVSYMNGRLMDSAFQHIIKKVISYLISSQLDQACDMKTDAFRRIIHKLLFHSWVFFGSCLYNNIISGTYCNMLATECATVAIRQL